MPSYAFAIGNVRMYLRIGPKTRTNRRFSKTRPDAQTKAKKENVSGETRTYGNPTRTILNAHTALRRLPPPPRMTENINYWSVANPRIEDK